MNSDYAANYRHLYMHHWWWRAREQSVLRALHERLAPGGHARILDIGCGDGLLFDKLAEFGEVAGVEICGDLVASDNPWRDRIHVGPFDETFQPRGKYSLILLLDVLEHLPDPQSALQQVSRLLDPDGFVVIHVPACQALWTSHDDLNHHYLRYNEHALREVLHAAELHAESMQYTFYWTCPAKLAVRLKERVWRSAPQSPRVPARWINAACYHLCRLEQRLFRHRSPGFGTSILAIARHTPAGRRAALAAPLADSAALCLDGVLVS